MITDRDIEKLKQVFATKDDLKAFATKEDLKGFATKKDVDNSMKRFENRIIRKLNLIIDHFDNRFDNHEERITRVEEHLQLQQR